VKPVRPESEGLVARIDAQISALQALRETVVRAQALGLSIGGFATLEGGVPTSFSLGGAQTNPRGPIELPVGAFRNKSIPDAIRLFLSAARQKQTIRQIAEGLKDGGLESTARHFETTVTGALHRLKKAGVLMKFKDGRWDLAESYPDHIRKGIADDSKPTRKATRRSSRRKSVKGSRKSKDAAQAKQRALPAASTADQILRILSEGPNSPPAFTARIGLPSNVIGLALGRLAKTGKIEKLPSGKFALKATDAQLLKAV
jgi:hypothetical protein